jgi:hypothetical protein
LLAAASQEHDLLDTYIPLSREMSEIPEGGLRVSYAERFPLEAVLFGSVQDKCPYLLHLAAVDYPQRDRQTRALQQRTYIRRSQRFRLSLTIQVQNWATFRSSTRSTESFCPLTWRVLKGPGVG